MARKVFRCAVVGTVAAVVLPTLGATPAAAEPAADYAGQQVDWKACSWFSSNLPGPVPECATIKVPRDWANPDAGPELNIAISRTRAADQANRKGFLFTNPGGPGGSGITLSYMIARLQPKVAAQYDIVGMDPRGVGQSTQLVCKVSRKDIAGLSSMYDSRDLSDPTVEARNKANKAIADGCAENPLTPYINTWQTAHDMDLIRQLLGDKKLNYLGYSYGSWLGAKYAALFPASTGKVVLDSNTSWMDGLGGAWELMPLAFQRRWNKQFLPWAVRHPATKFYLGYLGDVNEADFQRFMEEVRAFVIKKYFPGAGDFLDSLYLVGMYDSDYFILPLAYIIVYKVYLVDGEPLSAAIQQLESVLSETELAEVDRSFQETFGLGLDELAERSSLPEPKPANDRLAELRTATTAAADDTISLNGTFNAVRCGDDREWHSESWYANYAKKYGPSYPLATYSLASGEVCSFWSLPSTTLPNPDAHKLNPIVVVQSEFDAATGYENTVRSVSQYGREARLIAVNDDGDHGQYGIQGNTCVDDLVNSYLLDDTTPPEKTVCGALPLSGESEVHAVDGPVDSKASPKAIPAALADPEARRMLRDLLLDSAVGADE